MDWIEHEMKFEDEYDELEFLRDLSQRLWQASQAGRVTANDSYYLDHAWDLLEEYNYLYDRRAELSGVN